MTKKFIKKTHTDLFPINGVNMENNPLNPVTVPNRKNSATKRGSIFRSSTKQDEEEKILSEKTKDEVTGGNPSKSNSQKVKFDFLGLTSSSNPTKDIPLGKDKGLKHQQVR